MFKLRKIESTHSHLRTNEVIGTCFAFPKKGERFKLFAESLEEGGSFRIVDTSPVESIEMVSGNIVFKTQNSTYELSSLEGEEFI